MPNRPLYPFAIFAAVVAYALFAYCILALASFHLLTVGPMLAAAAASGVAGFFAARRFRPDAAERRLSPRLVAVAAVLCLPFIHAWWLVPFKEDDLMYHLFVPHLMAQSHSLILDPFILGAHFPMIFEFPLTLIEALGHPVSSFTVNTCVIFAIAYLVLLFLTEVPALRLWLAALCTAAFLTMPVVFDLSHAAYVELFFTLEILLVMILFRNHATGSDTSERSWYAACLITGLAVGTKYYGLLLPPALFISEVLATRQRKRAFGGMLLIAIVAAPFYIKNWVVTGNPVFPFGRSFFPSGFISEQRLLLGDAMAENLAHGRDLADALTQLLGLESSFDATKVTRAGGAFSVLLLLCLFGVSARSRWAWVVNVSGLIFFALWLTHAQIPRYLLPFAAGSLLIGISVLAARGRLGRGLLAGIAAVALGQGALNIYRQGSVEHIWEALGGTVDADTFLTQRYRGTYGLAQAANRLVPAGDSRIMLVGLFGRGYYFDAPSFGLTYFDTEPFVEAFPKGHLDPDKLLSFFRTNHVTHLALHWGFIESFHAQDDGFDMAAMRAFLSEHGAVLYENAPYQLIALHLPPAAG